MQDQITQMVFCVAVGCVLSVVVAAALSRPDQSRGVHFLLPRLVIAAGPIYLGADYILYQGGAAAASAAAGFGLGICILRGWWMPQRSPVVPPYLGTSSGPAQERSGRARSPLALAGTRPRATAARAALRSRMLAVVGDDRHAARPDDRSMPNAA